MSASQNGQSGKETPAICIMCSDPVDYVCGCGLGYCGDGCRSDDWDTHKLLCGTFKDFSNDNRPDVEYDPEHGDNEPMWRRAIYFDPQLQRPGSFGCCSYSKMELQDTSQSIRL